MIEQCINCSTTCYLTSLDGSHTLANTALVSHLDAVAEKKTYKEYSPVFQIIVEPLVSEESSSYTNFLQSRE